MDTNTVINPDYIYTIPTNSSELGTLAYTIMSNEIEALFACARNASKMFASHTMTTLFNPLTETKKTFTTYLIDKKLVVLINDESEGGSIGFVYYKDDNGNASFCIDGVHADNLNEALSLAQNLLDTCRDNWS